MWPLKFIIYKKYNIRSCTKSLQTLYATTPKRSNQQNITDYIRKQKMVVIRRSFPSKNKDEGRVLESKTAASVIRRLNWENKHLFGPVQTAKIDFYDKKKMYDSNEIIQHQTIIPIIDPHINTETISSSKLLKRDKKIADVKRTSFLNILLNFPLVNKTKSSENEWGYKISELNLLRKELEKLSNTRVPSVTTILEKTMPKESVENLLRWKQNMIKELGEEGFRHYQAELLANGSSMHECINNFLTETPEADLPITEAIKGHWKSLKTVFPYISDIKLMEERISHPFLHYKGVVDCLAKYRDQLVVIDWKTSKKAKVNLASTFDNPLQIAAYVGALNFDPKFQYLANKGLIVVAYENGGPASTHFISEAKMLQYWKAWLKRVKTYWEITLENNSEK